MANYKEGSFTGIERQRAMEVIIVNTLNGSPTVRYVEETVLEINNKIKREPAGQIAATINMNDVIQLRDPTTLQLLGNTIPVSYVYTALFSDYINKAFERDKPYPSWLFNETTLIWEAPVAKPVDEFEYTWNEENQSWDLVE